MSGNIHMGTGTLPGFLASLAGALSFTLTLPLMAFEAATLTISQPNRITWHQVEFEAPFNQNPIVIMGPLSFNGRDPSTLRIRNVTPTGFQFQIAEWDYRDGVHTKETIGYLAVEPGQSDIDGIPAVAGRLDSIGGTLQGVRFDTPFETTPIVLFQVEASNTSPALAVRPRRIQPEGFQLRLQAEEANRTRWTPRPVHFIALAPGEYLPSQRPPAIVSSTGKEVTHHWLTHRFPQAVSNPVLIAHMQTADGGNTASLRHRQLNANQVQFKVEEEQSFDPEISHTKEEVGYLVIGGITDDDGDGLPDHWERIHGLDPTNPEDAEADPDGDGFTNREEFEQATDPNVFDGVLDGGQFTIAALQPYAFEKELKNARFEVRRIGSEAPVSVPLSLEPPSDPTQGFATPDDYVLTDESGRELPHLIPFAAGQGSQTVVVVPVRDTQVEVPETLRVRISPSSHYQVEGADSIEITIADATNSPENERLFVATLRPEGMARTSATGLSTVKLDGDNRFAVVSLQFSGLTSPQTAVHIHVANPVSGPAVESLPLGTVTDHPWKVRAAQILTTDQATLDALTNAQLYVNVHSSRYPAGEIRGTYRQQEGFLEFAAPDDPEALPPLGDDDLDRDIARFLIQATYGPTPALMNEVRENIKATGDRIKGMSRWIDQQMNPKTTPPISLLELTQAADRHEAAQYENDEFRLRSHNLRHGWWLMAMKGSDHLRQRVAFALSQIFVISLRDGLINNRHYGAAHYYDMLSKGAFGSYRDLLENVTKHPIMGHYLSHLRNQREVTDDEGNVVVSPDENFAREIMQLFSIGLMERHPDGTIKLDQAGLPIPTYDQTDITEMARVMTGLSFSKRNVPRNSDVIRNNTRFSYGNGSRLFQGQWIHPMKFFERFHDQGEKTLVGGHPVRSFRGGESDLDVAMNALATHPNTAPFISRLLIQRLVTSNPTRGYVYRVARAFLATEGNLGAVVKQILLDREARDLAFADRVDAGKQKEPIIRYLALCRALHVESRLPLSALLEHGYSKSEFAKFPKGTSLYRMGNTDSRLSQTPLSAPTVFNWFLPDFTVAGSLAAAGLVAPEFQVTTESQVINAVNAQFTLLYNGNGQGGLRLPNQESQLDDNLVPDLTAFQELMESAARSGASPMETAALLVDFTDLLLGGGSLRHREQQYLGRSPRQIMIEAVAANRNKKIETAIYLYTTSPEYMIQK